MRVDLGMQCNAVRSSAGNSYDITGQSKRNQPELLCRCRHYAYSLVSRKAPISRPRMSRGGRSSAKQAEIR